MANRFFLQLSALLWKNWIVLSKYPTLTVLRCFFLPIAYALFLAYSQIFLHRLNNFGMGSPAVISDLTNHFDGEKSFLWADATSGTGNPSPADIIARITSSFTPHQLAAVKQVASPFEIPALCPQNLNGVSPCFAGVGFTDITLSETALTLANYAVNYTIYADSGLSFVDPENHNTDLERRVMPLQWSIDKAIIELRTGINPQTPLEWSYTIMTNPEQMRRIRLSFIRGIREIICLAFFVTFVGISYQIPGSVANERAQLITVYMKAMGLLDSARILSWHFGISITYLPAWVAVGILWKLLIFVETNAIYVVGLQILLGLVLASWSFFVAAPFGKSPQLAAIISTLLAIVFAVFGLLVETSKPLALFFISLIFPPSFYIFALKAICGYENNRRPTNIMEQDPDRGIILFPLLVAALINIFLWPCLAILFEDYLYGARSLWRYWEKMPENVIQQSLPDDVAISIRNLTKAYQSSLFGSKNDVIAVKNLSLDIPKTGILVLLGSNGAGKSTFLSILAGLSSPSRGRIIYENGMSFPSPGFLGIVPQKNVLFEELSCRQNLEVWQAVKWLENRSIDEDLDQLLRDCNLTEKLHANASTLSGGQKRKLQLAIGILGGSKVILMDECTSGVDPLSRRALWKTVNSFRNERSLVFTTHFLDEADLLADNIAILAPPGKIVALGSPVTLKNEFGNGYSVSILFGSSVDENTDFLQRQEILNKIHSIAPQACYSACSPQNVLCQINSKDNETVCKVLELLDAEVHAKRVASYDLLGTTIEDVFLNVMPDSRLAEKISVADNPENVASSQENAYQDLPSGRHVSCFRQALTIFSKRLLIARKSWLSPLLVVIMSTAGVCIPLVFISGKQQVCGPQFRNLPATPLYLPSSPFIYGPSNYIIASPPNIISTLGHTADFLNVSNVEDSVAFVATIANNYRTISIGGVSFDVQTGGPLIAWEASPPGVRGLSILNLATNVMFNQALNSSSSNTPSPIPTLIQTNYLTFPKVIVSTLVYLKWTFFFAAVMSVYPAFFAIYVSRERLSSVQAMQFSNGLANPIGLWLGHLMFDTLLSVLLSSIIVAVFAVVWDPFYGLLFFWIVLVLYGIAGALFAYCLSLIVTSSLASFAIVAGYQVIMAVLYLSSYLAVFTFAKISETNDLITLIHFMISFLAPVLSVIRAALVSVNLFSLVCDGSREVTGVSLLSSKRFGGPILYLLAYILWLLFVLRYFGSGSSFSSLSNTSSNEDDKASDDPLRVRQISKSFDGKLVAENVTFNVPRNAIFALLGPNGAGKTTTFNIIRGEILPETGDVFLNGKSIIQNPRGARSSLGVCPQFDAIDSQLTVREHLYIYGRLKGLRKGPELDESIQGTLQRTSLITYADRPANKLSGGNQRKLSLAICLMGNPSVLLIDEFSTGIDAKMKRDMWETLRKVSVGRAIVLTTHSMEEASAIATNIGILARRMLALGTTESLSNAYGGYEVHLSCRTREDIVKARSLMTLFPGSRMIDDLAARFEIPVEDGFSLSKLFKTLSTHGDFTEYTVERTSLDSIFIRVVRESNVKESSSSTTVP